MYAIGDRVVYGENGVCVIDSIGPMDPASQKLYYHLKPLFTSGTYFTPVDSNAFMRPIMNRVEVEALISRIPLIEPAICNDNRFNHVDAFYREIFRQHEVDGLVSIIKGLKIRSAERKSKSSRVEQTLRRAKQMLYGELSLVLNLEYNQVEAYIQEKTGEA